MAQPPTASYAVHLAVVCHGLWGEKKHVAYICKSAAARQPEPSSSSPPLKHVVLAASLNEGTLTYDGIDLCGERVVKEIDSEIERIREDGGEVTRFSIVGYSLGGLVARYAIGVLHSREPSFFKDVTPVAYTSFATPHCGIPKYKTFWSGVFHFLGGRLLSRTGSQLYVNDRFLPSSLAPIGGASEAKPLNGEKKQVTLMERLLFVGGGKEKAEPLLAVMADPRFNFYKALAAFERVEIYANAVNDRTVPYPTGAIEEHDPFALARAKAIKVMKARGEDPEDSDIDFREGGLDVKVDPDRAPLIASFTACSPPPPPSPSLPHVAKPKKPFKLPLLLRPSTYPFSRPVSLFVVIFLPITIPVSILYVLCSFVFQSRNSRQRIKEIRLGFEGGRKGMLARVGMGMRAFAEEVTEEIIQESTSSAPSPASSTEGEVEETSTLLKHESFRVFAAANYSGSGTPPFARAAEPRDVDLKDGDDDGRAATDPVLTDEQKIMIRRLNGIPQLKKHLTFLPLARNSHGIIIARDPAFFVAHREGMKVVDSWSEQLVL